MSRPHATVAAFTIKAVLLLGFGLIGGIWLFAGYLFTSRIADLERRSSAINARYMRAQDLLSTTRTQILIGSVNVRDALLDPSSAPAYRKQVEESYRAADSALQQYVPIIDATAERERIARLRREIESLRGTLLEVLGTESHEWPVQARSLLAGRIIPKREEVMRVSEEIQALNRSAFVQQQNEIAAVYRMTHRRVWDSFGLAVAVSLIVGFVAIAFVGRLEDRIRRQQIKDAENARDLQRLSSQLLTAQGEERRIIARELHDEVGQVLTAIKVELSVAQRAIVADGPALTAIENARSITDSALHTVRDLSHLLHPAILDDLGLVAATDWYLKGFARRYGVQVELEHEGMTERLTMDIEAAVYRIIQEAVTNVAKHAGATCCRVCLEQRSSTLMATIEDDGAGFDTQTVDDPATGRGLGLVSIRERALQLGGTARLESAPGCGTRLTVELPLRLRDHTDDAPGIESLRPIMNPGEVVTS
jgi:signal transduction histidine kinase